MSDVISPLDAELRAREHLANALTFLRSREASKGASGVTLRSSLADAIARLDSAPEETEDSQSPSYLETPRGTRLGELQRIEQIRTALLGDEGLLARLREISEDQG